VGRALAALTPDVVDVSSGVEAAPGVKDPARMTAFVAAVHAHATAVPAVPSP
jgi:phosphoribosylanthranilate isomerase